MVFNYLRKNPFYYTHTHTKTLQLVHSDIFGPMETSPLGGAKYFMTLIDDYSKKDFVYLHKKSDVLETFKEFKSQAEKQLECSIKCLRSDNGLEYVNANFSEFLKSNGIFHQTTTTYMPEQNGVAERMNRTVLLESRLFFLQVSV
ncbi:unnamed protein product [Leptosia nina]|uniref:Integrase catalytic domain-containing protein n=1 Tax=Leptosia nina TaxID=320188 RepID=A0AAV1JCE6_9NEOP